MCALSAGCRKCKGKKYAGGRVFTENMSAAVVPAGTIYLPQAQGALYLGLDTNYILYTAILNVYLFPTQRGIADYSSRNEKFLK